MDNKALVINVQAKSVPQGVPNKWDNLTAQMPTFTKDIITPDLQQGADAAALVSGVPTVFARATLFSTALQYGASGHGASALNQYYDSLIDEWRGLLACIALESTTLDIRQIKLAYSDGRSVRDTANPYEPKGAFGNMLFYRREVWCPQRVAENEQTAPVINIIKMNGKVVAGTSPDTLLFTSPNYRIANTDGKPYVDVHTGKFTDPLKSNLDAERLLALYAYIEQLLQKIPLLAQYYTPADGGRSLVDYSCVSDNLERWLGEIRKEINKKGLDLARASALPVKLFSEPFNLALNFTDELYGSNGKITQTQYEGYVTFNPDDILLDKDAQIARIPLPAAYERDPKKLAELSIYVLKADKIGQEGYAFFALPLSEMGIKVFGRNIGAALGQDQSGVDVRSHIEAHFDEPNNRLKVEFSLAIEGGKNKPIKREYAVRPEMIRCKDLLLWPNFISKQWGRYFLYSELPHNTQIEGCPFRAVPFVGNETDPGFSPICDDEGHFIYLASNGKASTDERVGAQLHIVADHRVSDSTYQYEVYESSHPFKGVRLSAAGNDSGCLLIRYTNNRNARMPYYGLESQVELHEAQLGIDFGSTNTSVAYYGKNLSDKDAQGIDFKDLRVSLLCDMHSRDNVPTIENSIFFFQGTPLRSNAIKSILTLQDERRFPQLQNASPDVLRKKEVSGGFPCFCKNLPVSNIREDEGKIDVCFVNGTGISATLIQNMKWSDQESDQAHKTAFLKSLLLQIYAQLFSKGIVPVKLNWSYPSAMSDSMVIAYNGIWRVLDTLTPVRARDGRPIKLDVTKYSGSDIEIKAENWSANTLTNTANNGGWGSDSGSSFNTVDNWGTDSANNGAWGSSASTPTANGGWDQPAAAGSWDDVKQDAATRPTVVDLKADNGPISFNFKPVDANSCQTEACAVANFLTTRPDINATRRDTLTLCFDVGGSTTDISALCMMHDHVAMIKQSSIRFAAQRISNAVSKIPSFEKVLSDMCQRYNLHILGFNMGPRTYTQETSPYFYEQLVDNLEPEQLEVLYHLISEKSPELFCINLYVTGLIMYYAGQLTNKLVQEVRRSNDGPSKDWNPQVQIVFAGKGSRIFEWFSCTNLDLAKKYSYDLFINGFGGVGKARESLYGPPVIKLNEQSNADNKFEVSKGLATAGLYGKEDALLVPGSNRVIEILGEEGFSIITADGQEVALDFDNSITPEFMEHLGTYFMAPKCVPGQATCVRFMNFCNFFFNYASNLYRLEEKVTKADFMEGFANMNLDAYIKNSIPEYKKAKQNKAQNANNGSFDFVAPIIIIEGMKFYDDVLLPKLASR